MSRLLPLLIVLALPVCVWSADETDPEPPGGSANELRKLKGTWTVTHALSKGKETKPPRAITYTFDKENVTYDLGAGKARMGKAKLDTSKRPFTIEITYEGSSVKQKGIYKIEKGQFFLAMRSAKSDNGPTTFDGKTGTVMVLKKDDK